MNNNFEEMLAQYMKEHPNKKKPKKRRRNKHKDYRKKALTFKDYSIRKNIKSKHYNYIDLTYEDMANVDFVFHHKRIETIDYNFLDPNMTYDLSYYKGINSVEEGSFKFKDIEKKFNSLSDEDIQEIKYNILCFFNDYCVSKYRNRFYLFLYDDSRSPFYRYDSPIEVKYTKKEKDILNKLSYYNHINNFYSKMEVSMNKSGVRQALKEEVKNYNTNKEVDTDKIHKALADEDNSEWLF